MITWFVNCNGINVLKLNYKNKITLNSIPYIWDFQYSILDRETIDLDNTQSVLKKEGIDDFDGDQFHLYRWDRWWHRVLYNCDKLITDKYNKASKLWEKCPLGIDVLTGVIFLKITWEPPLCGMRVTLCHCDMNRNTIFFIVCSLRLAPLICFYNFVPIPRV